MPRIKLKPNSPEFTDGTRKQALKRRCDMPGCPDEGEHKAPKDRSLSDYYWFCFEHAKEYNKAWDYFSGMSAAEMQDYIYSANIWERPTQRYDTMANTDTLKRKAWQTYNFTEDEPPRSYSSSSQSAPVQPQTPEFEALSIIGLAPPVTLEDVKARYKTLAKKYHPDHNQTDPQAEEQLKKINVAYTILKLAYRKFEDLPDRGQ